MPLERQLAGALLDALVPRERYGDWTFGLRALIGVTCACTLVFMLLNIGCMRPAGEIFPAIGVPLTWPLPPEPPRIRYVGELRGGADLRPAKSGWQVLREALDPSRYRPIRFITPHAIAIGADGRIYVADPGSSSLHVMDLGKRTHLVVYTAGSTRLRGPIGIAVAEESVFVTDAVLGDVFEFGLDGTYKRRLNAQLERPGGIAYCPQNRRLYVVDTAGHRCVCLGKDGKVLFSFGARGSEPGMFNFPTHVVYSPLLGLLISDTLNFRVQRFELDGRFVASIGRKGDGAGDFSLPKGVAVDGDGNLYVVDAHFENVQIFGAGGRLLLALGEEGAGPGQFSLPSGMAIDRGDRIWIADSHNRRLQVFQYLSKARP